MNEMHRGPASGGRADPDIETRHLRAFLAVAEAASFTKAADHLAVTQPALSRTIAQLERLVGARLFERGGRRARLTAAGARLLPHARQAIGVISEATEVVRQGTSILRIGFHYSAAGIHTVPIAKEFNHHQPDVMLRFLRFDDRDAGLLDGRSHVAFLRNDLNDNRIASHTIRREARMAALSVDDPLAARDRLSLDDLRESPLVISPTMGSTTPELWSPMPARPIIETRNIDEWLEAIALSQGIGVTAASTIRFRSHPYVRFVPLRDVPPVNVRIAWPSAAGGPVIDAFVDAVHHVIADQ